MLNTWVNSLSQRPSSQGKVLLASWRESLYIWDIQVLKSMQVAQAHATTVYCLILPSLDHHVRYCFRQFRHKPRQVIVKRYLYIRPLPWRYLSQADTNHDRFIILEHLIYTGTPYLRCDHIAFLAVVHNLF